jgi:hypothetical protein
MFQRLLRSLLLNNAKLKLATYVVVNVVHKVTCLMAYLIVLFQEQ